MIRNISRFEFILGLITLILSNVAYGNTHLDRFYQYQNWNEQLPEKPSPAFIKFIAEDKPLSHKLKKKWLRHLANKKDWEMFVVFYSPTNDRALNCSALTALYKLGNKKVALSGVKNYWLSGHSQPEACDELFAHLLKESPNRNQLLTQRIELALKEQNIGLAQYLLGKLPEGEKNKTLLRNIHRTPTNIAKLDEANPLHNDFYLYGLKRMISKDLNQAILFWKHVHANSFLSDEQKQDFLIKLSLYMAMRNHEESERWFAKIDPKNHTDTLIDWQMRYALKAKDWKRVEQLTQMNQDRENLSQQYWLARALEGQGKHEQAKLIYDAIHLQRNYYGFLASLRLNKPLQFEQEIENKNLDVLSPYQGVLQEIEQHYSQNQTLKASRLINDFALELPNDEKSALAY